MPTNERDSLPHPSASQLRAALTIAEDGLREIARPDCGIVEAEDGYSSYDTRAAGQIAQGTLRRLEEALHG